MSERVKVAEEEEVKVAASSRLSFLHTPGLHLSFMTNAAPPMALMSKASRDDAARAFSLQPEERCSWLLLISIC